jgi:hypothetical protein
MRTLLAFAVLAGALAATASAAEAGRRSWRGPPPPPYAYRPYAYRSYGYRPYYDRPYNYGGVGVCQERVRHFDPNRTFGGFPCWAREAFGQGAGRRLAVL